MFESMCAFLKGAFFQSLERAMRQEDSNVPRACTWIHPDTHPASGTAHFRARHDYVTGYFTSDTGEVVGFTFSHWAA